MLLLPNEKEHLGIGKISINEMWLTFAQSQTRRTIKWINAKGNANKLVKTCLINQVFEIFLQRILKHLKLWYLKKKHIKVFDT